MCLVQVEIIHIPIPAGGPIVDDEFFSTVSGLNFDMCMTSTRDYDTLIPQKVYKHRLLLPTGHLVQMQSDFLQLKVFQLFFKLKFILGKFHDVKFHDAKRVVNTEQIFQEKVFEVKHLGTKMAKENVEKLRSKESLYVNQNTGNVYQSDTIQNQSGRSFDQNDKNINEHNERFTAPSLTPCQLISIFNQSVGAQLYKGSW